MCKFQLNYALVGLIFLLILSLNYAGPGFRVFAANFGYIYTDKALFADLVSDEERNRQATEAVVWLKRSGRFKTPEQTLVFTSPIYSVDLAETAPVSQSQDVAVYTINRGIKYREAIVVKNLPHEWPSHCLQILHMTGNSTLMPQASLLGYIVTSLHDGRMVLQPIQIGIDTAEWAYDFPDMPPRHQKPTASVPLATGGLAYLTALDLPANAEIDTVTFMFFYPTRWHVEPSWIIRGIQMQATCK